MFWVVVSILALLYTSFPLLSSVSILLFQSSSAQKGGGNTPYKRTKFNMQLKPSAFQRILRLRLPRIASIMHLCPTCQSLYITAAEARADMDAPQVFIEQYQFVNTSGSASMGISCPCSSLNRRMSSSTNRWSGAHGCKGPPLSSIPKRIHRRRSSGGVSISTLPSGSSSRMQGRARWCAGQQKCKQCIDTQSSARRATCHCPVPVPSPRS